ncbi:MAG: DNA-binding protein [Candidatus Bathyarchaeia archaeon]|nr:DNA-binding protein [Candidatus Bathyarchaeota archaeon]
MSYLEMKGQREFLCKLPYDSDLLLALKDLARKLGVKTGIFMLLGALKNATLLYYIQSEKKYVKLTFDFPLEIVSGVGNIAVMNDDLIIHAHIVLADKEGKCYGGHLTEGSRVFSCEVYLRELSPTIQRKYDATTGLNLYDM